MTLVYEPDDSNLTVTVPTVIPFVMSADGTLITSTDMRITNGSRFAVRLAGVRVEALNGYNLVPDASASDLENAVDFQFGVDGSLIDAAAPVAKAGAYDMEADGGADTLQIIAKGDAANIGRAMDGEEMADITWTFTVAGA